VAIKSVLETNEKMGGAKVEDGPDEEAETAPPMPASGDPVVQAICARMEYFERRLDRMEKKFDERMQAIEDEGDPWLRHLVEYLKRAYARYIDDKTIKCV
jgi:hypothetical protein